MSTSTLTDVVTGVASGGLVPLAKATSGALRPNIPRLPAAETPPPAPERGLGEALRAATDARKEQLRKRGRVASILTGPRGDLKTAPLGRPTVGGGQLGL